MKTVLITGASSGFGKAIAELLYKSDYKLILVARREDRLEQLSKSLGNKNIFYKSVDITKKDRVEELFESLPVEFKDVDILINNAGAALGLEPAYNSDIDDWDNMVDLNIKGLLYLTKGVLPIMKTKDSGFIINIGSIAATAPYKGGNVYGATKAFVKQFSKNLRTDLLGLNIKVTNIEPGMADTEFSIVRFKGDKEKAGNVYKGMKPF